MSFARKHLISIEGYVPGEQPTGGYIKLNTNENPYPPSPKVFEALAQRRTGEELRKYPDALWRGLRARISEVYGVRPEQIFVGNGSDEVLSLLIRTFVDPGEKVLYMYPSYVLYETLAAINAVDEYEGVDLDDDFDIPEEAFKLTGKLFFVANPNSPTGKPVPVDTIKRLCESFSGIVVADEAYADFGDCSCIDALGDYPNLMILRTFSKAFSLASIRVGFALAPEELIANLIKTKDSYNVNLLSQLAAEAALDDIDYMRANVEKIEQTRTRLTDSLRNIGFDVYPSASNFLLARPPDGNAREMYEALKERKILVRYFPLRRLDDRLRISVGTDDEVDALLEALREILKQ
jgi:histidinol-phosphate aminotransferase